MRKKILWLTSWYPNRLDRFDGDFIQRHAKAAALYNDIDVIHLVADEKRDVADPVTAEFTTNNGLSEQIIYFRKPAGLFGRVRALSKWLRLYKKAIRDYIEKNGKPDLVHVNVPVKAGMLALWIKRKYRVEFVVTEHLGIYNDVDELKFASRPGWFKDLTKKILSSAFSFLTVSKFLGEGINKLVLKKKYQVIPNAVDESLFFFKKNENPKFRFIHVSNMVPLKNVEGILNAAKQLRNKGSYFELVMVGNRDDSKQLYAQQLGFDGSVFFMGEILYAEVAAQMQKANALILFSNIENSPCVIGEALCCGLPVIATKTGGIPELVDKENGMLIKPGDVDSLAAAMQQMIDNYQNFNREEIAAKAKNKFSYKVVGKELDNVYRSLPG
jgi:glycosyltransferase involved in cell wall biosynthesis